jgi:hypothetical protein
MKNLYDQKDFQTLGKQDPEVEGCDTTKDDVYVTRYITEWDFKACKMFTTISGDLHKGQKRAVNELSRRR